MLEILRSKGYLSRRHAKVTLSQRIGTKGMLGTRIQLGDWNARLAFMVSRMVLFSLSLKASGFCKVDEWLT